MRCYHCGKRYSSLHTNLGCSDCGLWFCNKRLIKHKNKLYKKRNVNYPICRTCYQNLTDDEPHLFVKRLEGLTSLPLPSTDTLTTQSCGASPSNQQLNSLERKNEYGEGPSTSTTMFKTERNSESSRNPEEAKESRLASLRRQGVRSHKGSYRSHLYDLSDSEEEMDRVTRKIMEEVIFEEKFDNLLPERILPSQSNKKAKNQNSQECNIEIRITLGDTVPKIVEYERK